MKLIKQCEFSRIFSITGEASKKAWCVVNWHCWLALPMALLYKLQYPCQIPPSAKMSKYGHKSSFFHVRKSARVIKTRRLWFYLFKRFKIYSHYWPSVLRWIVKVTVHKLQVIIHDVLNRFVIAFLFFVLITGKHTKFFKIEYLTKI